MYSRANRRRPNNGSVLPFVALSMTVIVAYVAFSVDITRNFLTVRKIEFAADSAAKYAYSFTAGAFGNYVPSTAQSSVLSALSDPSGVTTGTAWNDAPAGPQPGAQNSAQGPWNTGVTFPAASASFNKNPADAGEFFLQLTVQRTGIDALRNMFMSTIYAFSNLGNGGSQLPGDQVTPTRAIEVVGQPASRIGAGAPVNANQPSQLRGFATFPLAISNLQFQPAATGNGFAQYTADVMSSRSNATAPQPGHFKACFVNDAPSGATNPYYGQAQGNNVDQLAGLIRYFYLAPDATAVPPAAVERGGALSAYDTSDPTFVANRTKLINALQGLQVGQWLILPVIAQDPVFGNAANSVVGFAWLQLAQPVTVGRTGQISVTFNIGQSLPVRNATCEGGLATIPAIDGTTFMPPPVAPFVPRAYDPASNSISPRPRGLVLAPAISPRQLTPAS